MVSRHISGAISLEEMELRIWGEEASGMEFISSKLVPTGNLVEFNYLEAGSHPKPLMLTRSSNSAPTAAVKIWEGPMFVGGQIVNVTVWRKQD